MVLVGLTGGIGSGKSTVAAMLSSRGAVVIEADSVSREVVEPGTNGLAGVVARFGEGVLSPDGSLDRQALAAIVFRDPDALGDLNAIVHPLIGAEIATRLSSLAGGDAVVVLDIPLLVEGGGRDRYPFAGVLVVDCPTEMALDRLVRLREMSPEDAGARIGAQAAREARVAQADFVIMNMGSLEELGEMVERAWEWMTELT